MASPELKPLGFNARVALAKQLAKEIEADGYQTRLETDAEIERVRIRIQGHGFLTITTHGRCNGEHCRPQVGVFLTAAALMSIPLIPDKPSKRQFGEQR